MATLNTRPFAPARVNATVQLAVTNTPGFVQFDNVLPGAGGFNKSGSVRVVNAGNAIAFIELIGANQPNPVNPNTSLPILPNSEKILGQGGATYLAAVAGSGLTTTLYVTPGEGGI